MEDYRVNIALPAPVACEAGILNDGFEEPVIAGTSIPPLATFSGGNILILRENDFPWWGTISNSPSSGGNFDQRNGIEIWNQNQTAISGTLPFEGNQFAEINAFVAGRLYQDFTVPAGTQIRWQVAHRGRAGDDTMGIFLGPPDNEVLQSVQTTPRTEWRVYSGIYTVPAGQDITRFALRAQNTAGGTESSVGNFVDDVRLTNFCAPTVQGFKSVKLTDDVDDSNTISPHDILTYTLHYVNASDALTGPAANFQINDLLPAGLTITATGAQTITVSGNNTNANPNPNYTGAEAGIVSDLLGPGALLDVGGVIKVEIPVTVDPGASGILLNQGLSSANEFSGNQVQTDNIDSSTADLPDGVTVPEDSVTQPQDPNSIDPTRVPLSNNPNVLLVKRITQINDDITSLNGQDLRAYNPDSNYAYDDNVLDPGANPPDTEYWPDTTTDQSSTFLIGAIDGGDVELGDTVEYTIYFLSTGNAPAENVQICDRIPTNQSFVSNAYNHLPQASSGSFASDRGIVIFHNLDSGSLDDDVPLAHTNVSDGDSARYYAPGEPLPASCGGAVNDNGAIVVDLGDVPNATSPGNPVASYGSVRFQARVD